MTLDKRLSKLETSDIGPGPHDASLANLLGQVDCLFWPVRVCTAIQLGGVHNLRRQYRKLGIFWTGTSGGGSARAWKAGEREREKLAQAGLVTVARTGTTPLVKPTMRGEAQARQSMGMTTLNETTAILEKLEFGAAMDSFHHRGGWCSESWLFDSDYDERPKNTDWGLDTETMLPLLVGGWVESLPSKAHHIYYKRTEMPKPDFVFEDPPADEVEVMPEVWDSYWDGWGESQDLIKQLEGDEIAIMLSATI